MAVFAADTFTASDGTLLTSHTSNSGHTWVNAPSETATGAIVGYAVWDGGNNGVVYLDAVPASADYVVSCYGQVSSGNLGGPAGRISTSAQTFVAVKWNAVDNEWLLFEIVAGVFNPLGTSSGSNPATGLRSLALTFSGSDVTFTASGGASIGPVATAVSGAGRPGLNLDGNTSTAALSAFGATQADAAVSIAAYLSANQ